MQIRFLWMTPLAVALDHDAPSPRKRVTFEDLVAED
jgi:hypothetical protein